MNRIYSIIFSFHFLLYSLFFQSLFKLFKNEFVSSPSKKLLVNREKEGGHGPSKF